MAQEQGPKTRIGQIRSDLRTINLNIEMLQLALDGKSGSSVDRSYRATTEVWVGELRGMSLFGRYMLGEMTLGEVLRDADSRTAERYHASRVGSSTRIITGLDIDTSWGAEAREARTRREQQIDQEGIKF